MRKILLLSALVLAFSCDRPQPEQGLPNTAWVVSNMNLEMTEPIEFGPLTPTLIFNQNNADIAGNTGCNSFFGTYVVSGDSLQLNIVGQSMALCPNSEIEQHYLDALKNVATYKIEEGGLVLYNADNKPVASFIPMDYPEVPTDNK